MRSSMVFRQDSQLRLVKEKFDDEDKQGDFLKVFTFVGNLDSSLNWYLPRSQVEEIMASLGVVIDDPGPDVKRLTKDQLENLEKHDKSPPWFRRDLIQKPTFRRALEWNSRAFNGLKSELEHLGTAEKNAVPKIDPAK